MSEMIYILCALTALFCAILTFRSYRKSRFKLLFWSSLTFAGLFLNNIVLLLDKIVYPLEDFTTWRAVTGLVALLPLLYGLIWDEE